MGNLSFPLDKYLKINTSKGKPLSLQTTYMFLCHLVNGSSILTETVLHP